MKDIPMAHEVETMFSAREVPWHFAMTKDQTTITDDVLTAKQAIVAAGLDWTVEKRKMYTLNKSGNKILVPDTFAMMRVEDDAYLGPVRSKYVPFQNIEAFTFADNLVDSGDAKYETAGALRGGRVIFITMKVPSHIMIGGEDRHDLYILLRTSHDGTQAISVFITVIRVVCMNTLTVGEQASQYKWSMPHVTTTTAKLQEARDTLQMTFKYAETFQSLGDQLLSIALGDDIAVSLLQDVLPTRPKTEERIDEIMDVYRTSKTNPYHGTGWGLLNGLTEYYEHHRTGTQPEASFVSAIDGLIARYRNELASRLLARTW